MRGRSDSFIIDPRAHATVHKQEKRLKTLLFGFFVKFCKHHPALLTFENTYGMSSSKLAPSSWTLFHELFKSFDTVRNGVISEMEMMEEIDVKKKFNPHNHDLVPKFCIVSTVQARSGVEYMEAVEAAKEYDTYLEVGPMLESDIVLVVKEKLSAHIFLDPRVLTFVSDMSEGNPSIIVELCSSIIAAEVCTIEGETCSLKEGRSLQECKLNTKLRHMALREFSTLPLHEQLIAKMASVYSREFSTVMLETHVQQHLRDHADTFINLKKCIDKLLKSDIFCPIHMPDWMVNDRDFINDSAMIFRSKLMQKAVSELLLESHMSSVARSVKSAAHAQRISAFWLQKALDHELATDEAAGAGEGAAGRGGRANTTSVIIEDYLVSVPRRHRTSMTAQGKDFDKVMAMKSSSEINENGNIDEDDPAAVARRGWRGNMLQSWRGDMIHEKESEEDGLGEDEKREKERELELKKANEEDPGPWKDGVDRTMIVRNRNGREEPSSSDPELWNVDGTEVDFDQKYKFGSQLWYVQSRVHEFAFKGTPVNGKAMNGKAEERQKILETGAGNGSLRDVLMREQGGGRGVKDKEEEEEEERVELDYQEDLKVPKKKEEEEEEAEAEKKEESAVLVEDSSLRALLAAAEKTESASLKVEVAAAEEDPMPEDPMDRPLSTKHSLQNLLIGDTDMADLISPCISSAQLTKEKTDKAPSAAAEAPLAAAASSVPPRRGSLEIRLSGEVDMDDLISPSNSAGDGKEGGGDDLTKEETGKAPSAAAAASISPTRRGSLEIKLIGEVDMADLISPSNAAEGGKSWGGDLTKEATDEKRKKGEEE